MEFVIWASVVVHLLSAVVWLGGLIYYNAVLSPVASHEGTLGSRWMLTVMGRFQGFTWSTVWPLLLTGLILLTLQPGLQNLSWTDLWSWMIGIKIVAFAGIIFFAWQMNIVVRELASVPDSDQEALDGWLRAFQKLTRRSIVAGIMAILAAAALRIA